MLHDRPPLPPFDVGSIVPSTRDLLHAVRRPGRKSLALIPLLGAEGAQEDAVRVDEAGVTALALAEPGVAMTAAATAVRLPVLCLRLVQGKDDYLAARAFGADAVVLSGAGEDLAKGSRSTRMVTLELVSDPTEAQAAGSARAHLVRARSAGEVRAIASKLPPNAALVAWLDDPSEDDVRSLAGTVDAAIVGPSLYDATGFARLVDEVDG